MLFGSKKKDCKTEGSKTQKKSKMLLRGSKNTSKMEPKVVSGHGFFYLCYLISCNTTRVFFDFHGFWVPRGCQKNNKNTLQKTERRKRRPNTIFSAKNVKIELKMGSDLDHEFSPNSPPRGHCSDLEPKGAKKEPKGARRVPKDTKRRQKVAKMIPKSCENQ